jgi:acyl-CoA thioesterase-1
MKTIKVFFFGDSICVGQYVAIHRGWVPRISARLEDISHTLDSEILVFNASVNGSTTRQALERMPYEIQSQNPDILIVQFGMNDCNYWESDRGNPRVSLKAFEANLEEIILRAFTFGAKNVFLNTNHPTGRDEYLLPYTNISYQQSNQLYNEGIRRVAANFDSRVILCDMETQFRNYAPQRSQLLKLLLPDLLHLSVAGHDLYYQIIGPAIEKEIYQMAEDGDAKEEQCE